jgi:hypothetical protein
MTAANRGLFTHSSLTLEPVLLSRLNCTGYI